MTSTISWTPKVAQSMLAKFTKVAGELLDVAGQAPAPEEAAGTAGPQEVVDALDVIVDQLEEIQAAVPAEAQGQEGLDPAAEAPVDQPVAEEPVPEEEPKLAQATSRIAELEKTLEKQSLEKTAQAYGELFDEPKVQQAKYEEVIASKETSKFWTAKIDSITEYKENAGETSQYKPAKNTTSWIQSRTKVAKLSSNEMVRL